MPGLLRESIYKGHRKVGEEELQEAGTKTSRTEPLGDTKKMAPGGEGHHDVMR